MLTLDALHWEMMLRGAVAGLLLFHLVHLATPGARVAARTALGGFTASVLAYLFCQQPEMLLNMPRPLAYGLLALCVATTTWQWLAARALFNDDFRFSALVLVALVVMLVLGLAANLPYFPSGDGPFNAPAAGSPVALFGLAHAGAMLFFSAAALWEVGRGWRADLVASRRMVRRWVALGIGVYAALALVIELALRGVAVGRLLPALHVAGIGVLALGLAVLMARRSLAEVLGVAAAPDPGAPAASAPATTSATASGQGLAALPAPSEKEARALARLDETMTQARTYRREGLTLADLAQTLGMAEAPLRALINQRLGFRNFNDYLHHHRLQEATARLGPEDLPILSIALDCGYGSIGPFNRAFKQRLGVTPTEFRAAARLSKGVRTN